MSEPLRPVAASERVEVVDIVRGMALFGILAANMRGFAGPISVYSTPHLFWPALHDRIAQAFINTFVQGKTLAIFAFLFGLGFAIQLERAEERGGRFGSTFARRLLVLLGFGLVHGLLIWSGDILHAYALTGFALLLFRKRRDKTVAIWAVVALLVLPLAMTGAYVASRNGLLPPGSRSSPSAAEMARERDVYAQGSWREIQGQRMKDFVLVNRIFPGSFWFYLGHFLVGVLAWRKRFFQPAPESLPAYRRAMRWGFAIGITGNAAVTALRWALDPPMMPPTGLSLALLLVRTVSVPALSAAYVCLVVLLCQDQPWRLRLRRFAAVGRTALSNYLLQSVIGTMLFYSYGLGLFGRIGPFGLLLLTPVIFALQTMVSPWWLERHRFGPVEGLWRRLTYGRAAR